MTGIDLSCNKLKGNIPFQLGNLTRIQSLNLSHNDLTGRIPTGPLLPKSCNPLPVILPNDEDSDSLVDMFVFYVSFVVSYTSTLLVTAAALYINPYWRQAWFYYIELMSLNCYYFIKDKLCKLFKYANM